MIGCAGRFRPWGTILSRQSPDRMRRREFIGSLLVLIGGFHSAGADHARSPGTGIRPNGDAIMSLGLILIIILIIFLLGGFSGRFGGYG